MCAVAVMNTRQANRERVEYESDEDGAGALECETQCRRTKASSQMKKFQFFFRFSFHFISSPNVAIFLVLFHFSGFCFLSCCVIFYISIFFFFFLCVHSPEALDSTVCGEGGRCCCCCFVALYTAECCLHNGGLIEIVFKLKISIFPQRKINTMKKMKENYGSTCEAVQLTVREARTNTLTQGTFKVKEKTENTEKTEKRQSRRLEE